MFEFGSPIGRRSALRRLSLALGGVATAPLASGLLAGCRTPEADALASYAYSTLTETQRQTLAALVGQIIPETDTPGAAEAGVPQFIDTMLTGWYAPEERDGFLAGLDGVDRRAGGSFASLDAPAQAAMVIAMDAETFGEPPEATGTETPDTEAPDTEAAGDEPMDPDTEEATELSTGEGTASVGGEATAVPFYRQLKELTVAGYYTSEVGATQELQWLAVPGRYDADVPLS
ncbi:MAG: gluconate 2-dehydrogenase subunit 3 family protein, partial [Bacteroidota bacterium]